MIILAIETSCDETAAAIVKFEKNKAKVLANIVSSQINTHRRYGGVVPSLAARMHLKNMVPVLKRAFNEAGKEIDAVKKLSLRGSAELKQSRNDTQAFLNSELPRRALSNNRQSTPRNDSDIQSCDTNLGILSCFIPQNDSKEQNDSAQARNSRNSSSKIIFKNIDYIAVTNGPGLIPALMIGVQTAKTLSYALKKPLVGIHHIEGHIYANWLMPISANPKSEILNSKQITNFKSRIQNKLQNSNYKLQNSILWMPRFPILCLIVSGGHTELILMKKDLDYKIIGKTLDDAAGEAFDKVAKLLDLGYPGGTLIEKIAKKGDKTKFKFPRPMIDSRDYNFSFSGLKTAVLYEIRSSSAGRRDEALSRFYGRDEAMPRLYGSHYKADIAASFQQAIIDVLIFKTIKAAKEYKVKNIILGGGVSANKELQRQFKESTNKELPNTKYQILNTNLSTDNAVMIAAAAYYHIINNKGVKNWRNVKADANLKLV